MAPTTANVIVAGSSRTIPYIPQSEASIAIRTHVLVATPDGTGSRSTVHTAGATWTRYAAPRTAPSVRVPPATPMPASTNAQPIAPKTGGRHVAPRLQTSTSNAMLASAISADSGIAVHNDSSAE